MIAALDGPDEWEGFHCLAARHPVEFGLQTSGGALSFTAPRGDDEAWRVFCHEFGADELADQTEYRTGDERVPRMKELMADLSRFTHDRAREEILDAVSRAGGAMAVPVQTHREVFAHPQVEAIDAVTSMPAGRRVAPPWRINGVRPHPVQDAPARGRPAGE